VTELPKGTIDYKRLLLLTKSSILCAKASDLVISPFFAKRSSYLDLKRPSTSGPPLAFYVLAMLEQKEHGLLLRSKSSQTGALT
jgi:hypothetical protein